MNYAIIENGIVTNLIWLHPMNADEFPNAVPVENLPVAVGDSYENGKFYRDGNEENNFVSNITVESAEYQAGYDQAVLDLMEV